MGMRQIFGYFFLLVGGALMLVGAVRAGGTLWFLRDARQAVGTVVEYDRVEDAAPPFIGGEAGVLYYPVVSFDTPSGRRIRFTSPSGRNSQVYQIDERVPVYFDPNEPEMSRVDSLWGLWGGALVFAGLGGVFLLIGLLAPHGFSQGRSANPF